jgi:hypothetical protein
MVEADRKAFESVCTKAILESGKNKLALHVRIAAQGRTEALQQHLINLEVSRDKEG